MPDPQISIRISSSYPLERIDRLVLELHPILSLARPAHLSVDLSGLVWIGPAALALLVAALKRVETEQLLLSVDVTPPTAASVRAYLMRMDFLRMLVGDGYPEDREPFRRRAPVGFRPCMRFADADDYWLVAQELTNAMLEKCPVDDIGRGSLRACLDEVCENVVHHADAAHGGFGAAQAWPRKNLIEVAVVDLGVGIATSLKKNPAYADMTDDVTAIRTALKPRVSSTPERNAGIGLFVTNLLLRENGGNVLVRSGDGAVYTGAAEKAATVRVALPGTLVAIRARTDRPLDINAVYRRLEEHDANAGRGHGAAR